MVADNGSTDDSVDWLAANFPSVQLLRFDQNYGYAGGYNRALESDMCAADYCILLNSDVETPAGWVEPLIAKMDREPKLAALMPKILSYTDKARFEYAGASGGFIDGLGYPFCRGRVMSRTEIDEGQYDDARDVFWASGACLVVRREVFLQMGGFDADFFAHMEEIDLCWRMQLAGWRVVVEPASKVYHLGAGTLSQTSPYKTYLNYRNNLAMLYKNLSPRSRIPVIFTRMVLDGVSAMVYLVTGKPALFKSVWKAHVDYRRMKPDLKRKRAAVQAGRVAAPKGIWCGSIVLRYVLGKKKFDNII